MNDHENIKEILEIDFEVGHTSTIRAEPTTSHNPPRTHDWKVYLRSADVNGDLSCLIQRCVFHLHPEFPNHKRDFKSTPFAIQETGYAGFRLSIEIFFKTRKEPRKYRIEYDLDLHKNTDGHPYRQKQRYVQKYRCTFHDPEPDFRQKILAGGGKIVDSGPIVSNNDDSDIDEELALPSESIIRHSPPQKRPISPVLAANLVNNKKIKLEQTTNNIKRKSSAIVINNEKTVNTKKQQLTSSTKPSTTIEEKISKTLPIKESHSITTINEITEHPTLSKPRPSSKLIKTQSTNDIKSSIPSTNVINKKKKELVSSPSKTKSVINSQNLLKKPTNKNTQKISIKTEPTVSTILSTSLVKSPLNVNIKRELSPVPANNTTATVSINNLKKIPKKPPPPPLSVVEKRSRSSITSSSLNLNTKRDSEKNQSVSSKTQSNLKQDRPSLTKTASSISVNNSSNRSEKTSISTNRDRSQSRSDQPTPHDNRSKLSRYNTSDCVSSPAIHKSPLNNQKSLTPVPSKSIRSPSRSIQPQIDPSNTSIVLSPSIDLPQLPKDKSIIPSTTNSPLIPVFQIEDNHIEIPMDTDDPSDNIQLSDESNAPHEQIPIESQNPSSTFILNEPKKLISNRISHSDQSDTLSETNESNHDNDMSPDNDDDDEDLPTSLTDDNSRYKLIYIYKRFQLNSLNDLIIFVRFLKRHQLIDTSSLELTQTTNGMFTYDLFSLTPSHIGELANDLGYTTTSIEQ